MTRIVAGSAGGRRIEVPAAGTRPTSERVREALFSRLEHLGVLDGARVLADRGIPGVIVQGRYDMCCPIGTAWALHRAWPEAEMRISPTAGHAFNEPETLDSLIRATDRFATELAELAELAG